MKIKQKIKQTIILIFTAMVLPMVVSAAAIDQDYCDNIIYDYFSELFYGKIISSYHKYSLGEKHNRTIYKTQLLDYCKQYRCDYGAYDVSPDPVGYRLKANMVTLLFAFNNIQMFELLIANQGKFRDLVDTGMYLAEKYKHNEELFTPTSYAVIYGQYGVLKYLIDNYDVNLLKLSGTAHLDKKERQEPWTYKQWADYAVKKFQESGEKKRELCALEVKKIIDDWYEKNAKNEKYIKDAETYNKKVRELSVILEYQMKNDIPIFTPVNSFDMLRLNIEENYAQNIDKQIDNLMQKIMNIFDLSNFGNKA